MKTSKDIDKNKIIDDFINSSKDSTITNPSTKTETITSDETNTNSSVKTEITVKAKPKIIKDVHISTYIRNDQKDYRYDVLKQLNKGLKPGEKKYTLKDVDQMVYDFAKEHMKVEK